MSDAPLVPFARRRDALGGPAGQFEVGNAAVIITESGCVAFSMEGSTLVLRLADDRDLARSGLVSLAASGGHVPAVRVVGDRSDACEAQVLRRGEIVEFGAGEDRFSMRRSDIVAAARAWVGEPQPV